MPLRKVSLKRKVTHDQASFRETDLQAVYGPPGNRTCFQTARPSTFTQPVDQHHLYGRGGKDPADRLIHSSIFNLAFLRRDIHHGPMRDKPAQREAYLDESIARVMAAVAKGTYALTDTDRAFLHLYRPAMLEGC